MEKDTIVIPNKLIIQLMNAPDVIVDVENVILSLKVFAYQKNDYHLGPFFTNKDGACIIERQTIKIMADAELQRGIMDFQAFDSCSNLAEVSILTKEQIGRMLEARKLWGTIADESRMFGTKENLINKIQDNNNAMVRPVLPKRFSLGSDVSDEVIVKIYTAKLK